MESGEPTTLGLVLNMIQDVDRNLNRRLDAQDRELEAIKRQTTKTNGRVTALEQLRERAIGFGAAFRFVPIVVSAALTAGVTILLMAVTGAIH